MTLLITPLNRPSKLPQLPTLSLYMPTTSTHSTAPSSANSGINSSVLFPPINSDILKRTPVPWSTSNRTSRYEEILLTRLRIGHTRLTHSFLYLGLSTPPSCQYCHQVELSIECFFSCPVHINVRHSHFVTFTLSTALSNNHEAITKSLNYLRSSYFFASI